MPYKKYQNNYGWCIYPFMNSPLGYCWGFAAKVDKKAGKEEIRKGCSMKDKEGNYYCEYYKPILKEGEHNNE